MFCDATLEDYGAKMFFFVVDLYFRQQGGDIFLGASSPGRSIRVFGFYILTINCDLSKFVEWYALWNKEIETSTPVFVEQFILRHCISDEVISHQGTEFLSSIFRESCQLLGIKTLNSTAYPNQTLG